MIQPHNPSCARHKTWVPTGVSSSLRTTISQVKRAFMRTARPWRTRPQIYRLCSTTYWGEPVSFHGRHDRSTGSAANVVALKDATADMAFAAHIVARCGSDLSLLSGDDITALPQWSIRGRCGFGHKQSAAQSNGGDVVAFQCGGDLGAARRIHTQLLPLFDGLFTETNPVPVKTLVARHTGLCEVSFRLP